MIEYKHLIGKRTPRGFYTKDTREESIKFLIAWYLFLCKVKNNNKPLSQTQLNKLHEGTVSSYLCNYGIKIDDINEEHLGGAIQKTWHNRDYVIEFYTKKAGRPLYPKEMDHSLKMALDRYGIVKKELDYKIFGYTIQFDWERELKKDPDYIIKQFRMIWDFYGRPPTRTEVDLYCEEKNMPYTGGGLMTALKRTHKLVLSDIAKKFGTPTQNSYLVQDHNGKNIIVKSLGEVYIVNMLSSYKLEFDYEGLIHDSASYMYDFKLPDSKGEPVYIEYFGLNRDREYGSISYSNRVEYYLGKEGKKKNLYKENDLKLIALNGDFFDIKNRNKFQKQFHSLLKDNDIKVGKFKALCLEDLSKSKHDLKWDADKVEQAIKEILEEAGEFVSESDLRRMGRFDILNAIRVHHPLRSVLKIAEKLGYKDERPSGGITGRPPKPWLPFEDARDFVRSLGLKSRNEWLAYCRGELEGFDPKPENIPTAANQIYADEYSGIHDWIGHKTKWFYSRKGKSQKISQLELEL